MPGINALKLWLLIAIGFGVAMYAIDQTFLANVAFLVAGGFVASVTQLVSESGRRAERERDLARALYVELANRVARCVFDFERPWEHYTDERKVGDRDMELKRFTRFTPVEPTIYPATAGQLALLKSRAPQAVMRFYKIRHLAQRHGGLNAKQ